MLNGKSFFLWQKEEKSDSPEPPAVEKSMVCLRCGQIGHKTEDCKNEIPSISSMKKKMEEKLARAVENAPEEWKNDEYGLYLPGAKGRFPAEKTWKDGVFCFNCGGFGHTAEECKEPTFDTLFKMFEPYLDDNTPKAKQQKERIIAAINKFCESEGREDNEHEEEEE